MNSEYVAKTQKLLDEIREKQKLDFKVVKVEYVNEDGINYLRVYADMDKEVYRKSALFINDVDFVKKNGYNVLMIREDNNSRLPESSSRDNQE